jgi:ABC-2 type transport system permease protein
MPIYDQTFRRYEGARHVGTLWWPVARQILRPALKSRWTWILLSGIVLPVIVISIFFFVSAKLNTIAPAQMRAATEVAEATEVPLFGRNISLNGVLVKFLMLEIPALWLLVLVNGGGSICTDKKNNALPLYFSRPLKISDYVAGKIVGLTIIPAALLAAAVILIVAQAAAYFFSFQELVRQLPCVFGAMVSIVLVCLMTALSMAAFSSVAPNARAAGGMYFGFWFLLNGVSQVLVETTRIEVLGAVSPAKSIGVIMFHLIRPALREMGRRRNEFYDFGLPAAVLSIFIYAVLLAFVLRRSIKTVEVVK